MRKRTNIIASGVIFVILLLCNLNCRKSGDVEKTTQALQEQDKVFEDSFNRMNVSGVMSVYWESPDLIAMYPSGNYRGYDDVKQSWWDLFNHVDVKKFQITESHIDVEGDLAYEWGIFNLAFQPRSGPFTEGPGRYLQVWKNVGKKWLIIANHASMLPVADTTRK